MVPLTQEEGDRTDVVAQVLYDSRARWSTYGFVQGSVQTTGNREENGRIGAGGSYRVTDRFKVNGEVSGGDLGAAGRLGTEYLYSDRTTLYLNYALENDRTDNGVRARKGNLASGFRTRYSDSASVYPRGALYPRRRPDGADAFHRRGSRTHRPPQSRGQSRFRHAEGPPDGGRTQENGGRR